MTMNEFNAMDETGQIEAVARSAHISERQAGKYTILLYQIDGFYVEVYYHMKLNDIVGFRSFSNVDQLFPYLSKIDITELII